MSSAILYLAIIGIWACVLIPRWLRRDSARSHADHDATGLPTGEAGFVPATVPDGAASDLMATIPDDVDEAYSDADDADLDAMDDADPEVVAPAAPGVAPAAPGQSRRRVLAARRRLLWMMLALEAAADVLAASGLAAWWVIAPPTVMLAGYVLLLREAAQADAERGARERDAAGREQARPAWEADQGQPAAYPVAPPAVFAAAPVPEDYPEDLQPGRDFTPGGRYAASADEDAYEPYTEERLRAVGD